ncbi:hypothetical protein D4764_03G0002820 [Takifugu flavidus]|uniref:Ig-like domain-containing protein n=1 Tax=Takifugu flavidus TaxID=433684 RepID=A0A5C6N6Z1_9TELE|nr:hypothetical protein D4764_03G0002820 [Takifugu flavidus]
MNKSQTGTYYCGVASCQSIVFGAVTKVEFEDHKDSLVLFYFLCGASSFSIFLVVYLAFSVCMMNNHSCNYEVSENSQNRKKLFCG